MMNRPPSEAHFKNALEKVGETVVRRALAQRVWAKEQARLARLWLEERSFAPKKGD